MIKKIQRKLGLAATVAAVIVGAGWSLTTQSGSQFLASGSAILVRSWGEVFGAGGVQAQVGAAPKGDSVTSDATSTAPAKTVTACWGTEQQDLANLAGLLKDSNASLADLAAKLVAASSTCPTEKQGTASPSADALGNDTPSGDKNIIPAECPMPDESAPLAQSGWGPIILNEIAWMGSVPAAGESATKASNQEWIELKNISAKPVALNGWQIADSGGSVRVVFGAGDSISAGGFYLLSRSGNAIRGVAADKSYAGALSNSGGVLAIFDADCDASDFLDAAKKWPAGNNTTKQTMERAGADWQTSAAPGGTPRAENSAGLAKYAVSIAIQGDGLGTVISNPVGISCNTVALASGGSNCSAQFLAGTAVTLAATPGKNTAFVGWSGGCSGTAKCALIVGGMVSVNATFHSGLSDAQSESLADAESNTNDNAAPAAPSSTPPSSTGRLLIAQIQIAGAVSANDFVKIYNPTDSVVDVSGWKLRKKSSTGTDASLREFPNGTSIAVGAYVTWANSASGFAQSIGADASSTGTLSADNSVALFDAAGAVVDAVAWGTGTNQYVEGSAYPTNPIANQVLQRKQEGNGLGSTLVDSDNNAEDFNLP